MFGVPAPTQFDLRFRLLGIPVRVHPLFWVMAAILGSELSRGGGKLLLIWVACVFFSILVHEFGHALTARAFGSDPSVLLYMMGGLCLYQNSRESLRQRLLVLAMGPGAGFLLMGAAIAWGSVQFRVPPLDVWNGGFMPGSGYAGVTIYFLVTINFFWGILNLLPVMPLDGGQIAMVLLSMHDRRQGQRRAYIVSLVTAGLVAFYFVQEKEYYNALLFGMLALTSFQILQVLHHQASAGGVFEDDADWWKR